MPSFDVVSQTDLMEVDNAINGVKREITQRYDLAGTKCDISRTDDALTILADDNMKLQQVQDLLRKYLTQRKVDQGAFEFQEAEDASGSSLRESVTIKQGIDTELGKKISKAVRDEKLKVQVRIQGNELRVSGKNRDDLQNTISFIKEMNLLQPLQYINFRN
jgi:uncharacterized protein YajQ (UPF0234 family)